MGPRAGLDRCGKSRPPPGFDPRTVQPVASRYTDYATRPTERVYNVLKRATNAVWFYEFNFIVWRPPTCFANHMAIFGVVCARIQIYL